MSPQADEILSHLDNIVESALYVRIQLGGLSDTAPADPIDLALSRDVAYQFAQDRVKVAMTALRLELSVEGIAHLMELERASTESVLRAADIGWRLRDSVG